MFRDDSRFIVIPAWFKILPTKTSHPYFGKRALDIICCIVLCIVTAPLIPLICLLIIVTSGRPILFTQERRLPGGKPFLMYKFKTLTWGDENITFAGKILRPLRLNEFPQVINVFKGEMSFIGPRPLLDFMIPEHLDDLWKNINVVPGITGLSQVAREWDKGAIGALRRNNLEILYSENCTFSNDLRILTKTILVCLSGRGS